MKAGQTKMLGLRQANKWGSPLGPDVLKGDGLGKTEVHEAVVFKSRV
jgi:hypothetical protein